MSVGMVAPSSLQITRPFEQISQVFIAALIAIILRPCIDLSRLHACPSVHQTARIGTAAKAVTL